MAPLPRIRQMSGQVSRGSAGEYQADEQAGVARLSLFQKTKMIMYLNSLGKLDWLGIRENNLIRKRNQEIALI